MKVKMKKHTHFRVARQPGDVVDVTEEIARRWARHGIAEIIEERAKPLDEQSLKELSAVAEARGIDVTGLRSKADIIAKIEAAEAAIEQAEKTGPCDQGAGEAPTE